MNIVFTVQGIELFKYVDHWIQFEKINDQWIQFEFANAEWIELIANGHREVLTFK